jgi:hypothetical protein
VSAEAPVAPTIKAADVRASRGAAWIAEGFKIFRGQPLQWSGLSLGWLVITLGLFMIPLIGAVASNFLQPVFFASFALAAKKQLAGGRLEMGDLFAGFRASVRALVNIGAILLFAEIVIFALLALLGLPMAVEPGDKPYTVADYVRDLDGREWILVVGLVLTAIVKGSLWFTAPLIAFHGLSTMHAIRWSLYAALSNLGAMVAYGLALTVLFIAALIPWGLGLLLAFPIMAASTYAGYRDVFERE